MFGEMRLNVSEILITLANSYILVGGNSRDASDGRRLHKAVQNPMGIHVFMAFHILRDLYPFKQPQDLLTGVETHGISAGASPTPHTVLALRLASGVREATPQSMVS